MTGTKVHTASTEPQKARQTSSASERTASSADTERFRHSVRSSSNNSGANNSGSREKKEQTSETDTSQQLSQTPSPHQTTGDAILRGLQGSQSAPAATGAMAKPDADAAQNIVDRILVSTHTADGSNEIRIQLKEDILQGTEIRLNKTEGHLSVALVTNDTNSHAFLASHKHGLQEQLCKNFDNRVDVQLIFDEQGEPHDGRSRQQRNLYDEIEDS